MTPEEEYTALANQYNYLRDALLMIKDIPIKPGGQEECQRIADHTLQAMPRADV